MCRFGRNQHIPSHSFQTILMSNTWTFMVHFIQSGTIFTVPKQSKGAVHKQSTLPTSVPLGGTEFHSHFRSPTHQNIIYLINHQTIPKTVPKTATNCTNGSQKFSKNFHSSVPRFGTDQTATHGLNPTQTSTKHLNQE